MTSHRFIFIRVITCTAWGPSLSRMLIALLPFSFAAAQAPLLGLERSEVAVGEEVVLELRGIDTVEGEAPLLDWGDGSREFVAAGGTLRHRYAAAGSYTIALRGPGDELLAERTVTVGERLVRDLKGYVATSYYTSGVQGGNVRYGGEQGVLRGATVSSELAFSIADLKIQLEAKDVNASRQQLGLNVSQRHFVTALSFENIPPASGDETQSTSFSLNQSLNLEGLPRMNASLSSRARGENGSNLGFNTSVSDSHRDLSPSLKALRWQLGYGLTQSASSGSDPLTAHNAQLRLASEIVEAEQAPRFRPSVALQLRWQPGDEPRFQQHYELTLDADSADEMESLQFGVKLRYDSKRAPSSDQRVRYESRHFSPVALYAELSNEQRPERSQADYRLGVSYPVSSALTLSGGYHGRTTSEGSSHGGEASLDYRYSARPWYLSARLAGDLQLTTEGRLEPAWSMALNGRYGGEGLSASARSALNYRNGTLRGRVELSGDYAQESFAVSLSGGVLIANHVSWRVNAEGRVKLFGDWSLQGSGSYRAELGEDAKRVFTLGLGARFDFGGER